MLDKVTLISEEVNSFEITNKELLEEFRLQFLSKKGKISLLFEDFKNVPGDQKKEFGQKLNILKNSAQTKFNEAQAALESSDNDSVSLDFSLPSDILPLGA